MSPDLRMVTAGYRSGIASAHWTHVAGGFSGARVWHGLGDNGHEYALKAHPSGADPNRLDEIHHWMRVARGSFANREFVPLVAVNRFTMRTLVTAEGRLWEVCQWMPGEADFHTNPTDERLSAAVTAVARLHDAWAGWTAERNVPCPAIERRLTALDHWGQMVDSGWRPRPTPDDPVRPHVEAIWGRLPEFGRAARQVCAGWQHVPVPVQPCLCDVWHDHVLFTGDRVTGLIDYGAAKIDHVAVDLARLLGSLIPGDSERTATALDAYRSIRPLPQPDLVEVLDRTGVVVGLTNWLRWLYHDGRVYEDRAAVARRVGGLVQRLPG